MQQLQTYSDEVELSETSGVRASYIEKAPEYQFTATKHLSQGVAFVDLMMNRKHTLELIKLLEEFANLLPIEEPNNVHD